MRDINFYEVGMENFGPYIDPMILTFQNNSLTLVTGPNGIGKTMMLDSIPFTLYGVTSKGVKGDEVVNNIIGKNCHTWIKFSINEDIYEIHRYHKYTKLGNTVLIYKNKAEQPYKKGQKEVLPEVERLLCPKKSFMNTLMFGQRVKDFFTDLVDSDKKDIFRKILSLEKYVKYYKRADEILKELKSVLSDLQNKVYVNEQLFQNTEEQITILKKAKQDFYRHKEEKIKELNKSLESTKRLHEQWVSKLQEMEETGDTTSIEQELSEIENIQRNLEQEKHSEISELTNKKDLKLSEFKNSFLQAKQEIESKFQTGLNERRKKYEQEIEDIQNQISKLLEEKAELTGTDEVHLESIASRETQISKFESGLSESTCPTCLQTIDEKCQEHLNNEILKLKKEIREHEEKIKDIQTKRIVLVEKISQLQEQKELATQSFNTDKNNIELSKSVDFESIQKKIESVTSQVQELYQKQLQRIEENYKQKLEQLLIRKHDLTEVLQEKSKVKNEIEEIKQTIEKLETSQIQLSTSIQAKEKEEYDETQLNSHIKTLRDLEIEKVNLQKNISEVENDIEITDFWKGSFSSTGIPSLLIDEAIPFMNQRVSYYLEKLTNGRYIVSFDTLAETKGGAFRDKISVNVLDTHTRASSRMQLSGGQTRIIDIATILTLGDLQANIQNVSFNILLFDEIFDSLDEENIGFVSKVLSTLKVDKAIYLISHRHEEQLEADQVLVLNK